jgi:hypothetical protein
MDNLLLDLALLTVGAHRLIVGAVPLSAPIDVDGSYVDGGSIVVFIIDTTYSSMSSVERKAEMRINEDKMI